MIAMRNANMRTLQSVSMRTAQSTGTRTAQCTGTRTAQCALALAALLWLALPAHAAEPGSDPAPEAAAETAEEKDAVEEKEAPTISRAASTLPKRTSAESPTEAQRQIKAILAGPDFSPEETIRMPAFKKKNTPDSKTDMGWMKTLEKIVRGIAEVMRAGVWVLVGLGVILLLFALHYWWRVAAARPRRSQIELPVQVGGLDIRRESLPADIGGAARAAWLAGDVIGALSLLYRGALSALVLRFGAAIRASFTEQECLRAARSAVKASTADYFQGLTRAWLHAVYARRRPDDAVALALCDQFNAHFAERAAQAAAPQDNALQGAA